MIETIDFLLNVSGIAGVVILLASLWLTTRGHVSPDNRALRAFRILALFMVLFPLFVRWYLSASLLFTIGMVMMLGGATAIIMRKLRL